jgi:hypothetical protein
MSEIVAVLAFVVGAVVGSLLRRRSSAQQEIEVGREVWRQWLRAGRPPMQWFAQQSDSVREALAEDGDAYARDVAAAVGWSVRDPEAAQAVASQDADSGEERLLDRIATVAAMSQQRQAAGQRQPMTMAGVFRNGRHEPSPSPPADRPFGGDP